MYRPLPDHFEDFVGVCQKEIAKATKKDRRYFEGLAKAYEIFDKNTVKELIELAIVREARKIVRSTFSWEYNFNQIVQLYRNQVNLSMRTSTSIMLQQYSTPAPIGYLAGLYTRAWDNQNSVFEPSAGNGLLTILADPKRVIVNEIDSVRRANLESQNFREVWKQDASQPFKNYKAAFDCVITNPPFGRLDKPVWIDEYKIVELDHLMALHALSTLKPTGRMAFIIGGHNRFDERGRFTPKTDLFFFNLLYAIANVEANINIDGHQLYSRQGTAFDTRLILINGRRTAPDPNRFAPLKTDSLTEVVINFDRLFKRVIQVADLRESYSVMPLQTMTNRKDKAKQLLKKLRQENSDNDLSGSYWPGAFSCQILDTVVPDTMDFETHRAISRIKKAVGGDFIEFVRERLGYATKGDLCESLAAEQIDAVAMAIYNIEYKRQGMIIGDQTGIGKGRQAAAIIRYAVKQGLKPVFITEKPNLFSDLYRDLVAIGSGHLRPFIVNSREGKTDIKDENGDVVYQAPSAEVQKRIILNAKLPTEYDFVVGTYSQFNNVPEKVVVYPPKPNFLYQITQDNVMVMDESHNSSGDSNTGRFLTEVVKHTRGVVFLSATFAKRPDNMPIYAAKTCISEANMSNVEMVAAITNGGVALQEIISSQLVSQGQMIRRERTFEGIQVNYITLDHATIKHSNIADSVTEIMREIISFQFDYVYPVISRMDKEAAESGGSSETRKGTKSGGVDNTPYFSKVFMVINQMLFAIKAPEVALKAIERLREGKKPVIAFSSTMGAFLDDLNDESGEKVLVGDTLNTDFSEVLRRGLRGVMRYTKTTARGKKEYGELTEGDLSFQGQEEYQRILNKIRLASTGINISPIDVIVKMITDAGYKVAEVTGRKYEVKQNLKDGTGVLQSRKKVNTNDAFRRFNNNEADVILINQSGSTGASAHAIPTDKVPPAQVRQRVMIILQAELNINTEIQKRGRINRTGQILKPEYDYISSTIPAEMRLMMMLQKKLKSLDANTSSNQKNSKKMLDYVDFLNKYGDKVVLEYLTENPKLNSQLGDPLKIESDTETITEDAAHRVTGRVAILPVKDQEIFYQQIIERYNNMVELLKQTGDYDLEVETLDLQATTLSTKTLIVGKGGKSPFSGDSILEKCEVNNLRKPFTRAEVEKIIEDSLNGKSAQELRDELTRDLEAESKKAVDSELKEIHASFKLMREAFADDLSNKSKNDQEQINFIEKSMEDLEQQETERVEKLIKAANNRLAYLQSIFNYFLVGRGLQFPRSTGDGTEINTPCVFLGFTFDKKRDNPYLPSAIKLRFALADSMRYLSITASNTELITILKGASVSLTEVQAEAFIKGWDAFTAESRANRRVQYIITGNLLQAAAMFRAKLVSYTLQTGATKKGILLPFNFNPFTKEIQDTQVPIIRALPVIKSLMDDAAMYTNSKLFLVRNYNEYKIIVPASKAGKPYYTNSQLLRVVNGQNFFKSGDKMSASVSLNQIDEVVAVLQNEFSLSVTVKPHQLEYIQSRNKENNHFVNEDDQIIYSELVDLEAKLLLMLNHPISLNGTPYVAELDGAGKWVKRFSRIYSAYQCTDLNDVTTAIKDVHELIEQYKQENKDIPRYVYIRLNQLNNRMKVLERKEGLSGYNTVHPKINYFDETE
jgi:uncharacterized protein YgiM (DUF1202 family)